MSKAPIIRTYAWRSALPQLVLLGLIMALVYLLTDLSIDATIGIGALIYLAYSLSIRALVAKAHKAGIRRVKAGDFAEAIPHFQESYTFFSQHAWLDRFRYLLLGSSSKASYKEMALLNIAFCYSQLGKGEQCRAYYEQAVTEFPDSVVAKAALNMARSFDA